MTKRKRILWTVILNLVLSGKKRTELIRKHHLYGAVGENCYIQMRYLPLYSNLVFLHNNVKIASNVGFVTHDIIHTMLNQKFPGGGVHGESWLHRGDGQCVHRLRYANSV